MANRDERAARSSAVQDHKIADLIGHVYDAALDSSLWRGIAPRIADAFDSTSAVLKLHAGPDVRLLDCTGNMIVPDTRREWAEHWHQRDLWVERTVAFGLSVIVTDRDLVTPQEQRESGFYREWLPTMDIFHVVGAAFPVGDGAVGVLGVHRPEKARHYGRADRQRAAFLLPHLQRALHLSQKLGQGPPGIGPAELAQVLDRLDAGVLVLDRTGRIRHANAMAQDMLRTTPELCVRQGRFCLRDMRQHDRFARLVRSCIRTAAGAPEPACAPIAIARQDRLPMTLAVAPLSRHGIASGQPLAIVFLRDPEYPAIDAQCLRELFGLTRTEAAVAADLGRGRSLERIARDRGIGLATVRSHLKQILAKTGTNRQAEAAALVAYSVAGLQAKPETFSPK